MVFEHVGQVGEHSDYRRKVERNGRHKLGSDMFESWYQDEKVGCCMELGRLETEERKLSAVSLGQQAANLMISRM